MDKNEQLKGDLVKEPLTENKAQCMEPEITPEHRPKKQKEIEKEMGWGEKNKMG